MTIHDVDMDPVRARGVDRAHPCPEAAKAGCENGRRNDQRPVHPPAPVILLRLTRALALSNAPACTPRIRYDPVGGVDKGAHRKELYPVCALACVRNSLSSRD